MILDIKEVTFRYPDGSVGLSGCSLGIERGSRTVVMGANGAGKTTLFMHLNAILKPQSGSLLLNGEAFDYSRNGLKALRSRVGMVFQNPDSQLFSATVREDVSFGPMNLGLDRALVEERVEAALEAAGISSCANKPVHSLSFGQKKRVCIAGVLAMAPEVLVLDEAMAGLDRRMQGDFEELLNQLHAKGMTILVATHDIDFAYSWADRIHLLSSGSCAASWDASSLPEATEQLESFGLGIPSAIKLHRLLARQGILPDKPMPRNNEKLMKFLDIIP